MPSDPSEIRLIISDLDNTLLPQGRERISEANIRAISNAVNKGIGFLLDTGRHYTFLSKELFEDLPLNTISTINGACLVDGSGHTLFKKAMSLEQMNLLTAICEADNIGLGFKFEDALVTYAHHDLFLNGYSRNAFRRKRTLNGCAEKNHHLKAGLPLGAFLIGDEKTIEADVRVEGITIAWSQPGGYDAFLSDVNKATAAEYYLKKQGLDWKNAIAFGDAANDTCFIEKAGIGVAMENGRDEPKQAADLIAPPCINDGVASVLHQLHIA